MFRTYFDHFQRLLALPISPRTLDASALVLIASIFTSDRSPKNIIQFTKQNQQFPSFSFQQHPSLSFWISLVTLPFAVSSIVLQVASSIILPAMSGSSLTFNIPFLVFPIIFALHFISSCILELSTLISRKGPSPLPCTRSLAVSATTTDPVFIFSIMLLRIYSTPTTHLHTPKKNPLALRSLF